MSGRTAVVLIGSPRPVGESASEMLAGYLGERLEQHGISAAMTRVTRTCRDALLDKLIGDVEAADLFVLVSPLYVDSLPYLVIRTLERIGRDSLAWRPRKRGMLAIINCGFPEPHHTAVALDICRIFARRTGFDWLGGLGLGGGEAIRGRRLQDVRWISASAMRALDLTAAAVAAGRPTPDEAVALMARPLLHPRAYTMLATADWYRRALRNGVIRQLRARPFMDPQAPGELPR